MLKQNLAIHVYINYNYVLCCNSYSSKYFQHDLYKIVLFDKLKKHEIYE